jgi:uroporphyrinogen decarboxylase
MTQRERFFSQMSASPTLPCPNWEFTYWETTLSEWHKQGLPKDVDTTIKAYRHFGIEGFHFDEGFQIPGGNMRLVPSFEPKSLGLEHGVPVYMDGDGVKFAQIAEGQSTIPHYLDYPVKSRRDWEERYKPRLDPDTPGRFPDPDWDAVKRSFDASGKPVCLYLDSYIGYLRNLMGFEAFSMLPYDDLDLFDEMVETLTVIKERQLDRLAGKIRLDMVHYWEDICYNAGPIVQPQAFHDIVVPRMKRVNNRLRKELGVKYISLDCDGNFLALLDGWIESGVNILMPCEVDAGMDILMLQERYGDRCGFHGGIQKKALIEGPAAIERELRRVQPAVQRGGYIPHLDHACPANVPLENYVLYLKMKREMLGCGAEAISAPTK